MLRLGLLVIVVVAAGVCRVAPASAADVSHDQTIVPLSSVVAANECTGEDVQISGQLHVVTNVVEDTAGGAHVVVALTSQDLVGTGLTTGTVYHGREGSHSAFTSRSPQNEITAAFSMTLASSGSAANLLLRGVFHETVNANGEVSAHVELDYAGCAG
jgi:hypothetical protein